MTDQPYTPIIPTTEIVENQFVYYEAAFMKISNEASRARFRVWLEEVEAAAEQRGAEAALLCVDEPSWEHHDQTDGFPCTNCLNKAQKSIDRYRADQMESDDE